MAIKAITLSAVLGMVCAVQAEKLQVYAPPKTVEERIALAERTLEYVKKSVSGEKIDKLAAELAFDKAWWAKAKSEGEKYACARAIASVRRRILFLHPDLQFKNLLAVQRGFPFSEEAGMTDQYAGRWSRPGPGLVEISNWKVAPHKRALLAGKLPRGCTLNPCLHWDADRVLFAFNDHETPPPVDPRKFKAPHVMNRGSYDGERSLVRPPVVDEVREADPTNPNLNPTAEADEYDCMCHRYFLYEAAADGSWVRQLTGTPEDPMTTPNDLATVVIEDADPCYMPDGSIVFSSTRAQNYGRCHWGRYVPSYLLYAADLPKTGPARNIRQFSFAEANEWHPSVLDDGRLVYTRWDYVDRVASRYAGLWVTRQDGTAVDIIYGNYCITMRSCAHARQVPGTRYLAAVAGAHHMFSTGTIVLIDPLAGQDGEEPLTRLTPDTGILEAEGWYQKGAYMDPTPVNDVLFFASYSPDSFDYPEGHPHRDAVAIRGHWQNPRSYGVWLVDRLGGRELIYQDPEWSTFNPIPVTKRKTPPVMASNLPPKEKAPDYGICYLQNVYDNRYGIPSNSVAAIRINKMINMNACRRESWHPGADYAYYRETLGTVPVAKDGSAYFKIPAETPIQLVAVDTNGMAVMTMRSEIYAQRGEIQGCAGCHEAKTKAAPVLKRPVGREPDAPVKEVDLGYAGPISYLRSVQPIFDRHCISCHGLGAYKGPKKPYSLIGTNGVVNLLYEKFGFNEKGQFIGKRHDKKHTMISTAWCYGETIDSRAYDYYAAASPLTWKVKRGHGGARLADAEWKTLILWLDSNVPGYSVGGGYGWNRPDLNGLSAAGEKALREAVAARWGAARAAEPIEALVNRADPAKSRVLLAALPEAAGGWGQWEKPFAGKDDPEFVRFAGLADACVVRSPYRDVRGTCGRDDACECNSCWIRRSGINDPKVIHAKKK